MCDSVFRRKWALGWDSQSQVGSDECGVWDQGALNSSLLSERPIAARCCPVLSLLSQTVWELFLWCSNWRWSNRDRQATHGKKGRFPEGVWIWPGWIQSLETFFMCVSFSSQCSPSFFWPLHPSFGLYSLYVRYSRPFFSTCAWFQWQSFLPLFWQ